jgi:hypothetical protein
MNIPDLRGQDPPTLNKISGMINTKFAKSQDSKRFGPMLLAAEN